MNYNVNHKVFILQLRKNRLKVLGVLYKAFSLMYMLMKISSDISLLNIRKHSFLTKYCMLFIVNRQNQSPIKSTRHSWLSLVKLNTVKFTYLEYDCYMISEFVDTDIRKMKLPEKAYNF